HLVASVKGEKFAPARHEVVHAIKAVTYHQLKVHKTRRGWATTIIFDV
ncbi:MAG: archease, partial [Planctomycetes bacterium]|nr:archease [Planctomycetota bacterium]